MELIDRYLYEVRRHLSYKNREDILKELHSALTDALENQYGPNPTREQVAAVLKEFGSPQEVAARYHPEGQYLVGPALYPLFKLVMSVVITTVIFVQVIVWLATYLFGEKSLNPLGALGSIYDSALVALGWVVIVFMILQHFEVRPQQKAHDWDPNSLPPVTEKEEVDRVGQVAGIIVNVIILSILTYFQGKIGMYTSPGGTFYENPVIPQYLVWIGASLLVNIGLSVYLLWQGRWTKASRWAQVGSNLLGIVVLGLLVSSHQAWLQSHGVSGFQSGIDILQAGIDHNAQVMMMIGFWVAFGIGLISTVIATIMILIKLVQSTLQPGFATIRIQTGE